MLRLLREQTEGKLQILLSHRKNSLDSLFKEVRVFKDKETGVWWVARLNISISLETFNLRFRVRFQVVKVPIFGGFSLGNL